MKSPGATALSHLNVVVFTLDSWSRKANQRMQRQCSTIKHCVGSIALHLKKQGNQGNELAAVEDCQDVRGVGAFLSAEQSNPIAAQALSLERNAVWSALVEPSQQRVVRLFIKLLSFLCMSQGGELL